MWPEQGGFRCNTSKQTADACGLGHVCTCRTSFSPKVGSAASRCWWLRSFTEASVRSLLRDADCALAARPRSATDLGGASGTTSRGAFLLPQPQAHGLRSLITLQVNLALSVQNNEQLLQAAQISQQPRKMAMTPPLCKRNAGSGTCSRCRELHTQVFQLT
mmetsp:Transcript_68265/g.164951  ORF Transcript_68265/g.164951 Transcript_68265/m.164951 type:complete len:161 (+) Transcript_68265:135-617(+)